MNAQTGARKPENLKPEDVGGMIKKDIPKEAPTALDHYYDVELANGRIIRLNTILRGCTLNILENPTPYQHRLIPVELEVYLRYKWMDWFGKGPSAIIVCAEKIVRIPWGNETLIVHGDGSNRGHEALPLPEDPYEAIRQAYLDGTDTESEPFEDPIDTETPESPLNVAPPTSLPDSAPPALVHILCRTARMAMRVPPTMSSGLSTSMAKVATMSESVFRKRFRSSYESLPSLSLTDLLAWKRYRGTVSEDAEDEGPTADDEDPITRDEGLAAGVEGPGTGDESYGLDDGSHGMDDESRGLDNEGHSIESDGLDLEEGEEAVLGGQQQAAPVVGIITDPEDSMVYIDVPTYPPPLPVQTPPSLEWTSGSLPISTSPSVVPSLVSSPMISLTVPSPVATPAAAETKGDIIK
ncbi:hypothetical protein Tco_0308083 [Tanacetum coccineum]